MDYVMSVEVCRSCRLSRGGEWGRVDDLLWGPWMLDSGSVVSGRVGCPLGRGMEPVSVSVGLVPEGCPYRVEHVVLGGTLGGYLDRRRSVSVTELHREGILKCRRW